MGEGYALEGVRVLDFTWIGVGPVTAKYLADNGADVVKIESAARPDALRLAAPWKDAVPDLNGSQFFGSFNSSKRSVSLDLSKPKAREIVLKLVPHFDVVTESFTPKAMQAWGLDYETLRKIRPDLIMFSTCMQGQTGPNRLYPGYGNLMAALSGFYHISGYPDSAPMPPYGAYTDFVVPRFASFAILAALDYRRRTGQGQYIDISQYEAALHMLAPPLVDYFATGRVMNREGNRSHRYAPHGAYRCKDSGEERWITISVEDDDQWRAMLGVLGNPSGADRFATMSARLEHAAELDDFVQQLVHDKVAEELTAQLQSVGVAAYPVQNCVDLHSDENLEAFDFWHWLDHKQMGPMPYEGLQHRLSETPGELRFAAPVLGQHTDEILTGLAGMSPAEIEQLRQEQVIF